MESSTLNQHISFFLFTWEQTWSLPASAFLSPESSWVNMKDSCKPAGICCTLGIHTMASQGPKRSVTQDRAKHFWSINDSVQEVKPFWNLYPYTTSLRKKKSGASACAGVHESPLWLDVHLLQGILELGVSWLDLVSLVQREAACYQDHSMGCGGTLLGDKPAKLQLQE